MKEFDYIVDNYGDFVIRRNNDIILHYVAYMKSFSEVQEIVDRLNGDYFEVDSRPSD